MFFLKQLNCPLCKFIVDFSGMKAYYMQSRVK